MSAKKPALSFNMKTGQIDKVVYIAESELRKLVAEVNALRAVAKAAREWQRGIHGPVHDRCRSPLCKALIALDAALKEEGSK